MSNENSKAGAPDLSALLNNPMQSQSEAQDEAEDAAAALLLSIKTSLEERDARLNAQDIEIRMLKGRLSTMETFVSYLLEQDPGMRDRMKAMAEAAAPKAPENVQG